MLTFLANCESLAATCYRNAAERAAELATEIRSLVSQKILRRANFWPPKA
jgi:hypothetical protein